MNKFQFNPPNGLLDASAYPTNPSTEAEARGQIQAPLNQIKNYLNLMIDEFAIIKEDDGWQKLPSGLIFQWGKTDVAQTSQTRLTKAITFPIKFPNACPVFFPNINVVDGSPTYAYLYTANGYSNSAASGGTITIQALTSSTGGSTIGVKWFALGY